MSHKPWQPDSTSGPEDPSCVELFEHAAVVSPEGSNGRALAAAASDFEGALPKKLNLTIIGTGYVGLTTGISFAYLGHDITCVDIDQPRIEALNAGIAPFHEPHLERLLHQALGNISFTSDFTSAVGCADVVLIAVGTPPGKDRAPDLESLRKAVRSIGSNLKRGFTVVVNKSTVPIGSAEWVRTFLSEASESPIGSERPAQFAVCSNPEFLRQGSAFADTFYPDRVVIGSDDPRATALLEALYRPILDQDFPAPDGLPRPNDLASVPLVRTDLTSAELIKYAANAFLAVKLSFINEIAGLAELVGADIGAIQTGIGHDRRIGRSYLKAGIGWGGSCLGKDTAALAAIAAEYGLQLPVLSAARQVNYSQRRAIVHKLLSCVKSVRGKRISILGLSFKPDTDDLRDAPSLEVIRDLLGRGANVRAHDPICMAKCQREHPDLPIQYCCEVDDAFDGADAVVIVTEWRHYERLDWPLQTKRMRTPIVVDGRNLLDPASMARAGVNYVSVGR